MIAGVAGGFFADGNRFAGIVLQEMLSGIKDKEQFDRLRAILAGFRLILATEETHIEAARLANACRAKGVAVSTADCLIAALAIEHDAWIFTTDKDFVHMSAHCDLQIFGNR